jgi:hypothetical protein
MNMKKLLIALSFASISLMAVDYSQLTTEELNALKATITAEEQASFKAEMEKRIQAMTPQEQAAYKEAQEAKEDSLEGLDKH